MEKEYYEAQIKYINEIRSIRHDIQAHMIVLQYYLDSGNYEKARAYLGDMQRSQKREGLIFKDTGNDLVNAIACDALGRSQTEITLEISGLLPETFPMSEYDTCTLFSNLLSNACEACEKLKHTEPVICMEVHERKDAWFIVFRNPIEWKIRTGQTGLVTSKMDKESHGFGVKNMMKVIKKYEGKMDLVITENSFQVEITARKM